MAWTNPKTWAISEVVTAAMLNTHIRDNLNWILPVPGAWTSYVPVLTDAGGVQNVWNDSGNSRYFQSGKLVVAFFDIAASVGGGNYGTGNYAITLPAASAVRKFVGNVVLFDNSLTQETIVHSVYNTSTTIYMLSGSTPVTATSIFTFSTLDHIRGTHIYEAA